ncbi:hypothetical protein LCGC14_1979980 [marine sediment metagenome]|uniref:Uncharacterized protein n=1 Tax=marine sediment metagenome TaxID=412755 RepID=A0A0F9I663_9ZZZZ
MIEKVKIAKLIIGFLGLVIGCVISILFLVMLYTFIKYSIIEFNPIIVLLITLFFTFYSHYRILRMITKKETAKYIYK